MAEPRVIDAYCEECQEQSRHKVLEDDPGTCACMTCGHEQVLMVPIKD